MGELKPNACRKCVLITKRLQKRETNSLSSSIRKDPNKRNDEKYLSKIDQWPLDAGFRKAVHDIINVVSVPHWAQTRIFSKVSVKKLSHWSVESFRNVNELHFTIFHLVICAWRNKFQIQSTLLTTRTIIFVIQKVFELWLNKKI